MKKLLIGLGLVAATVALIVVMSGLKPKPEKRTPPPPRVVVDVQRAEPEDVKFVVSSQGTVLPKINSSLIAEVSGKIVEVSDQFVIGGHFSKGDVLVVIDPSNYEADVKAAEARLAQTRAVLLQEEARAEQAGKDWQNINKGKGTPSDLVLRKPQLAEANANVRSAQADLERARRNLQRTRVTADFDGLVKSKTAALGQYVSVSTRLADVYGTEIAEIRLPITDRDLPFVKMPRRNDSHAELPDVELTANFGGKAFRWQGKIVRSEGVIDESNRVSYIVAQVDDPYGLKNSAADDRNPLPYGIYTEARVEGKLASNVYVLPRNAVNERNEVRILDEENRLTSRAVEILRSAHDKVYISAGLETGDRVVMTALEGTLNGTRVTLQNELSGSASGPVQQGASQ